MGFRVYLNSRFVQGSRAPGLEEPTKGGRAQSISQRALNTPPDLKIVMRAPIWFKVASSN